MEQICTGFFWPIWTIHGRDFNVRLENEEGIFHSLINNLLAVGRQDRGSCLGETDHCQPLTPLSLLSDSHSKPHLCADFILSSLSFYVGEKLFVYDMKPELEAFPWSWMCFENINWKSLQLWKCFFPCCWCIMLNKPFGVFTVGTASILRL